MDVLSNKNVKELLDSLTAEAAKASNEIRCAQQDINKTQGRLNFVLVLINELKNRSIKD